MTLVGRMIPEYDTKTRFLSSYVTLPITFVWEELSKMGEKDRLFKAMELSKGYYSDYLNNPCTFQLMAQLMQIEPPRDVWPYKHYPPTIVTNIGVIDDIIPTVWPVGSPGTDTSLIEIEHLRLQHRWTQGAPSVFLFNMCY